MMHRLLGAACLSAAMALLPGCPSSNSGTPDTGNVVKLDGGGTCTKNCSNKACGDDGCGGSCGDCAADQTCNAGKCEVKLCVPNCTGKDCGSDGCGGFCGGYRGGCPEGKACSVASKCEQCTAQCAAGQECGLDAFKCSCGSCAAGLECNSSNKCVACTPKCDGKTCGDDGCGGTCGTCASGTGCTADGKCAACTPGPECAGKTCGVDAKGCSCGSCAGGLFCQRDGTCGACADTGGTVTIDTLCTVLDGGLKKWAAWQFQSCGLTINDTDPAQLQTADIDHLDLEMYANADYGITMQVGDYAPFVVCSKDLKTNYEALKTAVKAGNVCFDSRAVDECIQAGKDAKKAGQYGQYDPPVCSRFFVPHQAEGQACQNQWECVSGLYCKATDGGKASCGGVCAKPLAVGQSCTERDVCEKDSRCRAVENAPDAGTVPMICTALPKVGESCAKITTCVSGAYCSTEAPQYDAGTTADGGKVSVKVCRAYVAEGGNCLVDSNGNDNCADGFVCTSGKCGKPPAPGAAGATCDDSKPCGDCLFCNPDTNKCTRATKIGDSCVTIQGTGYCVDITGGYLTYCDATSNKCKLFPRAGQPCTVEETDYYGDPNPPYASYRGDCLYLDNFCKRSAADQWTGVCTAYPKLGEPCNDAFNKSATCEPGLFCKGATAPDDQTGAGGVDGVCAAPQDDGTACTDYSECKSGNCLLDASGNARCAQAPPAGQPCALDSYDGETLVCAKEAYCLANPVVDGGTPSGTCTALSAAGTACKTDEECATGLCGVDGVCALDCLYPPGSDTDGCGDYTGFNWFAKYIFVSGTLVFLATRRRKKQQ